MCVSGVLLRVKVSGVYLLCCVRGVLVCWCVAGGRGVCVVCACAWVSARVCWFYVWATHQSSCCDCACVVFVFDRVGREFLGADCCDAAGC